jgi:mannose/cellobiose epimerase-like protein (N-acyl-D-glucosamine 2-epimerase family)
MAQAATAATPRDRAWLLDAASALYVRARADGWGRGGQPGFVYTVDWAGEPIAEQRLSWVAAEATGAAAALAGVVDTQDDLVTWWGYIADRLVDRSRGSWWFELDRWNRPATTIWRGRPDLYHAYQACAIPRFPLARSVLHGITSAASADLSP